MNEPKEYGPIARALQTVLVGLIATIFALGLFWVTVWLTFQILELF